MTTAFDWTGPIGDVWAEEWRRTDRSLAGLADPLDAAILAAATDAGTGVGPIVDIGCGAGTTSMAVAAALPERQVRGIDISPALIGIATERGQGLPNLSFVAGAAEEQVAAAAPVDLLISRHGVMFFPDPVAAFAALRCATAPGGRLVFSCFRAMALNSFATEPVIAAEGALPAVPSGYAPGPFAFADPVLVRDLLTEAGWSGIECTAVDFAYRVGEGSDPVADALGFLQRIGPAARALRAAPPGERTAMVERVTAVLEQRRSGDTVDFPAAAWLCSAHNMA